MVVSAAAGIAGNASTAGGNHVQVLVAAAAECPGNQQSAALLTITTAIMLPGAVLHHELPRLPRFCTKGISS